MPFRWDESKRLKVLAERSIDFADLNELLYSPYVEEQSCEIPEQYRVIGFVAERLVTFIIKYRADDLKEYIWIVTAWKSTKQERTIYDQQVYKY